MAKCLLGLEIEVSSSGGNCVYVADEPLTNERIVATRNLILHQRGRRS